MVESTVRSEVPKGALMQTPFACGREFAPCTSTRGVPAPATLTNRGAGWMPETFRGFITTKGGDPLPSTPSNPTVRRLDAGNVSPFHHDSRGERWQQRLAFIIAASSR